ncbi:ABC transporter permease [Mycobacterium sp. KBS0706]|uniref:ABC transporter permease n=1 Tax=Mycobacterium sp. KBS0706 TaxID=2578109 RepID=UPI00110F6FA9|nr:ABC transporter permease [Mycobacterium sp. KBS0706]TSD84722.1 ABC transporter permease [Mycobacterium sp. KBS0706]
MIRNLLQLPRQAFLAVIAVFMAAPLVVVAGVSLNATRRMSFPPERFGWNWYEAFFSSPAWLSSLQWSLLIAAAAALVSTSIAVPVAYGIWRFNSRFSKLLSGIGALAFMLPPVVLAVVFMIFWGFIGHVGRVENTVLSHAVVLLALPLVTVSLGFQSIDRSLIEVAATMGATDNHVFRTVIAPIVMPYVLCGALFVFVLSINEYIIAYMVAGFAVETLPIKVFNSMRLGFEPTMCVGAVLFMLLGAGTFCLIARFGDLPKLLGAASPRD